MCVFAVVLNYYHDGMSDEENAGAVGGGMGTGITFPSTRRGIKFAFEGYRYNNEKNYIKTERLSVWIAYNIKL